MGQKDIRYEKNAVNKNRRPFYQVFPTISGSHYFPIEAAVAMTGVLLYITVRSEGCE